MKKLEDISKSNNFKVPEGYFENLDKQIENNVLIKKEKNNYKSVYQVFKPYIYMAACILLLAGGLRLLLGDFVESNTKQSVISEFEDSYFIDELLLNIIEDYIVFYEYLIELESDTQNELQITDAEYIEDYLAQYYIEYELFDE